MFSLIFMLIHTFVYYVKQVSSCTKKNRKINLIITFKHFSWYELNFFVLQPENIRLTTKKSKSTYLVSFYNRNLKNTFVLFPADLFLDLVFIFKGRTCITKRNKKKQKSFVLRIYAFRVITRDR